MVVLGQSSTNSRGGVDHGQLVTFKSAEFSFNSIQGNLQRNYGQVDGFIK